MTVNRKQVGGNSFITVICDNYATRDDLDVSWGFSCLIKHGGKNILFDTGGDGIVLLENMSKLGIDPASIDLMMISHQHWDHTGGIYHVLSAKRCLPVCLPYSFSSHFKEDMRRYGAELIEVTRAQEILPCLYSTGALDGLISEQAALLRMPMGNIVITGCAHPGIINIVKAARKAFPHDKLALVMGGFHLLDADDKTILKIISQLKKMGVLYAAASHCSGKRARELFALGYKDRFIAVGAGTLIHSGQLR